jgi:hypothetical protein
MTQFTFKIADLEKLIHGKKGNLLVEIVDGKPTAKVVPSAGGHLSLGAAADGPDDGGIEGCPYPPGCN